jgi:hypothetical protein
LIQFGSYWFVDVGFTIWTQVTLDHGLEMKFIDLCYGSVRRTRRIYCCSGPHKPRHGQPVAWCCPAPFSP